MRCTIYFIALQHAFACCLPSLGVSSLDLGPFYERPSFLCGECPAYWDDDGDPDHPGESKTPAVAAELAIEHGCIVNCPTRQALLDQ